MVAEFGPKKAVAGWFGGCKHNTRSTGIGLMNAIRYIILATRIPEHHSDIVSVTVWSSCPNISCFDWVFVFSVEVNYSHCPLPGCLMQVKDMLLPRCKSSCWPADLPWIACWLRCSCLAWSLLSPVDWSNTLSLFPCMPRFEGLCPTYDFSQHSPWFPTRGLRYTDFLWVFPGCRC